MILAVFCSVSYTLLWPSRLRRSGHAVTGGHCKGPLKGATVGGQRYCHGTVLVLSQYCHVTVSVLSWYCRNTVTGLPGSNLVYFGLPGFTWVFYGLPWSTWVYWGLLGSTCVDLCLPTWIYLSLPGSTWVYFV